MREDVLGIPDVGAQADRHFVERLEERGKGAAIGARDRVVRLGEVEVGGAVIGVDDDLDGVADVADARRALGRVGIATR